MIARMVELVDTRDLKSLGHYGRAGSIPALRTKENGDPMISFFFALSEMYHDRSMHPYEKHAIIKEQLHIAYKGYKKI